jgi:hypothetical protein
MRAFDEDVPHVDQFACEVIRFEGKVRDVTTRAARYGVHMERMNEIDWGRIEGDLDSQGWARVDSLMDHDECDAIVRLYDQDARFRSTVTMARHGFGKGEYRYFAYALPELIGQLRAALYPRLVPIANRWHRQLGIGVEFPDAHADFLDRCHAAGQARPTPLVLRYGPGDYNCLHQDLYGEHVFPLQVAILLNQPGEDFAGGEFLLTEQRPRMQSRGSVVPLEKGDAVIFAVSHRPVEGSRGSYRVTMRHGVSAIRSGRRHTLGIIFHDAA